MSSNTAQGSENMITFVFKARFAATFYNKVYDVVGDVLTLAVS